MGCSCGQAIGFLVCLVFIALAVFLPVYYLSDEETQNSLKNATGIDFPEFPNLPPSLRDKIPELRIFQREDPFHMTDPDDANRWTNDGSGLELEVVNALDSQWHEYFDVAIDEWENGSPDALTLTTSSQAPDYDCTAIDGLQKTCNGDYGETDWKGINKVLLQDGWIVASMARMNDYFFADGGDVHKRQYTMCHELGKTREAAFHTVCHVRTMQRDHD